MLIFIPWPGKAFGDGPQIGPQRGFETRPCSLY